MIRKTQKIILKSIFQLKSNFAPGIAPRDIRFHDVEITPYLGGALAAGTISADFEISWAFRGRAEAERLELATRCRRNVPFIVRILEEQDIPITWATVGHLFLERCECSASGQAHADMPRPPKNLRWEGDWYRHDPCTDLQRDPYWYAPDLIALIRTSKTRHEIGSHSFSHIDFSADTSTPELVRRELEECLKVMAPHGLPLRSLVYPFNNMGHHYLDLIGSMGLTAVRHRDQKITLSYPESTPHGVYKLYETLNFRRGRGYDYLEKARIFLEAAMERNAAFHLWFHPSDPTELFEREFHGILKQMAELKCEGKLWAATMGDLAAYCDAREKTKLDVQRKNGELSIQVRPGYDAKRYGPTMLTLRIPCASDPKECSFHQNRAAAPASWKNAAAEKENSRSIYVDVPAEPGELRLLF